MNRDWEAFKTWLRRHGAEVLPPTNPYELVRFRARGGTHIIYQRANGMTSMAGFAEECLRAFDAGTRIDMGQAKTVRNSPSKYLKQSLLDRDGRECFFCLGEMPNEDMTVEHLVPIHKGGPNHQDNMALAHRACNQKADNLPLMAKIKMRESALQPQINEDARCCCQ
jgi:hypothetical protein